MRRVFVIFYSENHKNGSAVWRCLSDKNQRFLLDNRIRVEIEGGMVYNTVEFMRFSKMILRRIGKKVERL